MQEVHFPCHVVNQSVIHADPGKIEAVKNWKAPRTLSKIRSFLGLACYDRRFITNFSKIAKPLNSLTQKNQKYVWGKANVVADALSRKERVKPKRIRAMAMTIQSGVKGMILAAQGEAFNQENVLDERLHGLDQQMERKGEESLYFMDRIWVPLVGGVRTVIMDEAHKSRYSVHPREDKMYYDLRDMYWWPGMKRDIATYVSECLTCAKDVHLQLAEFSYNNNYHTSIRCAPFEALYGRKCRSPVLWAKIGEGSLIGPELVQETIDKVVIIKEKLKAARDRQKSYADNRRKPLEFEKKGKLASRYVGPFEILERISSVAYRLRLSEELSGVHDTFHVSNHMKCLADASLHVPLDEIKVYKTLRFVEELVEIMDHEIKSLKRSKISLVKVRWNSKRGPEFTWEREDYMKSKYPQLFVDRADESAIACRDLEAAFEYPGEFHSPSSLMIYWGGNDAKWGSPVGIHGLFSGWYCGLASRKVTLGVSMAWAKGCALSLDKLAMPPHLYRKFRIGVAIATGYRGYYKPGTRAWVIRGSHKIRIPVDMYPCRVEERLTIKLVKGEEELKIETTVTAKDGTITKFPRKFPEYKPTKGEEEILKLRSVWEKVNYDISDSDSDLESTTRSGPRDGTMEDTGGSGIRIDA
ncbi:putative reverse transcriptase domain-containing protein [Tanacetum coccineum]